MGDVTQYDHVYSAERDDDDRSSYGSVGAEDEAIECEFGVRASKQLTPNTAALTLSEDKIIKYKVSVKVSRLLVLDIAASALSKE